MAPNPDIDPALVDDVREQFRTKGYAAVQKQGLHNFSLMLELLFSHSINDLAQYFAPSRRIDRFYGIDSDTYHRVVAEGGMPFRSRPRLNWLMHNGGREIKDASGVLGSLPREVAEKPPENLRELCEAVEKCFPHLIRHHDFYNRVIMQALNIEIPSEGYHNMQAWYYPPIGTDKKGDGHKDKFVWDFHSSATQPALRGVYKGKEFAFEHEPDIGLLIPGLGMENYTEETARVLGEPLLAMEHSVGAAPPGYEDQIRTSLAIGFMDFEGLEKEAQKRQ